MAAAVSPAVAEDFDANVSMITDFNETVNLMPDTKDVDATPDIFGATAFDGLAVVSKESRKVHVEVNGYTRDMETKDITFRFNSAGKILLFTNIFISIKGKLILIVKIFFENINTHCSNSHKKPKT